MEVLKLYITWNLWGSARKVKEIKMAFALKKIQTNL